MNVQDQFEQQGIDVRHRETEAGTMVVADLGPATQSTVDVVGETAIIVTGEEQYEIEVPADAQAFITNGVLTIEVNE